MWSKPVQIATLDQADLGGAHKLGGPVVRVERLVGKLPHLRAGGCQKAQGEQQHPSICEVAHAKWQPAAHKAAAAATEEGSGIEKRICV